MRLPQIELMTGRLLTAGHAAAAPVSDAVLCLLLQRLPVPVVHALCLRHDSVLETAGQRGGPDAYAVRISEHDCGCEYSPCLQFLRLLVDTF